MSDQEEQPSLKPVLKPVFAEVLGDAEKGIPDKKIKTVKVVLTPVVKEKTTYAPPIPGSQYNKQGVRLPDPGEGLGKNTDTKR